MKRVNIGLGSAFLLALISSNAHAVGISPISYGFKLGSTLSAVTAKNADGTTGVGMGTGTGFILGPSIDIGAGPIGVMMDVMYAMRKSTMDITVNGSPASSSVSYNQLFIPVVGRLSLGFLRFVGGLYYASNLGSIKFSATAAGQTVNSTKTWSSMGIKSSGYGVTAGLGLSILMVSAEVRYNMGLSNDLKSPTGSESSKFHSIDALLGINF